MKVFIQTFGCQMNKLDSEMIAAELVQAGHYLVENLYEAEIILFNACSVRQHAEERVYARLAQLKKIRTRRPNLIIGLVGCMAEKEKTEALRRIPYLNLIVGPHQHKKFPFFINSILSNQKIIISTGETSCMEQANQPLNISYSRLPLVGRKEAYIMAMRGCDNFCSYCVVPYLRGQVISRPIKDIVEEAKFLAQNGCQNITLLGQNIAAYGIDHQQGNLAQLLTALHDIKEIKIIRFLTSHPAFISKELLKVIAQLPKIEKLLHIPAQSGSNRILSAMNRKYTREQYLDIIKLAREIIADIEFSSDFIVGFPGETESDFQQTIDLVKQVKFKKGYVFKYSIRPGTKAAELVDDVPLAVKKDRHRRLLSLFTGSS